MTCLAPEMEFIMAESTSQQHQTTERASEDVRMGGEGFGNVVMVVVAVGALILAAVVIFAILALTGQFENDLLRPPV